MLHGRQLITRKVHALLANITGWQVLRIFLGLILLVAALLKVHELSTTPYLDKFPPRWVMIVFTELEILFALWLLFVPKRLTQITWLAILGLFSFFTCVTLYKALTGEASCGCFGRVEINPWYTLIFDSIVVGLLLWFRPAGVFREAWRVMLSVRFLRSESGAASLITARTLGIGAIWLIFCIPSAWSMLSFVETNTHGGLSALGQVFEGADGKPVVVLEPKKWVGKEFPLLGHIDIGKRLNEGEWIILLFHHDCPNCQKAIPVYANLGNKFLNEGKLTRIALVEVPPFGDADGVACISTPSCMKGRLNNSWAWFFQAPIEIQLNDGIVIGVAGPNQVMTKQAIPKLVAFLSRNFSSCITTSLTFAFAAKVRFVEFDLASTEDVRIVGVGEDCVMNRHDRFVSGVVTRGSFALRSCVRKLKLKELHDSQPIVHRQAACVDPTAQPVVKQVSTPRSIGQFPQFVTPATWISSLLVFEAKSQHVFSCRRLAFYHFDKGIYVHDT